MTLEDTVQLMLSSDYKDRFKAEYYQLRLRFDKLSDTLECNSDKLNPLLINVYEDQLNAMDDYLTILEHRAEEENIDISEMP